MRVLHLLYVGCLAIRFRLLHDACGIVAQVPPSMRDVFPADVGTIRVFGLQEVRAHAALCANQMSKA